MPDNRLGVVVTVHGRVQGVWYRGWTVETATAFGLSGWVRNKADGTVEALFVGTPDAVEAMVTASWEGPPAAKVERVERRQIDPAPDEHGFRQLESER